MSLTEIRLEANNTPKSIEELLLDDEELYSEETPQSTENAEIRKIVEENNTASYTPTPPPIFSYKGNDITSIFIIFILVMFGIIIYLIYLLKEKNGKKT